MKEFLLQVVLRVLLILLAEHTRFQDLLRWVRMAEDLHTNAMAKRGEVYRQIKEVEPDLSQSAINSLLELAVVIYKARQDKQ